MDAFIQNVRGNNMKKIIKMIVLFVIVMSLCSCSSQGSVQEDTIFAMDTVMTLSVYGDNAKEILTQAEQKIYNLESLFSVTNTKSEVSTLNKAKGKKVQVSQDTYKIVEKALEMSTLSKGAFQISLYPVTKLWGFTTGSNYVPTKAEISEALTKVGDEKIRLSDQNQLTIPDTMQIDLGGIAKGFTSQTIIELAKTMGADGILVSLGGNVQAWGEKPDHSLWKIGIAEPKDPEDQIGCVEIDHKAVITSGGYQRYFVSGGKTYEHIMDPETGLPVDNDVDSVTIVCEDAAYADAMSTALTVMGKEKAIAYWKNNKSKFDFILVCGQSINVTSGLKNSYNQTKDGYNLTWIE